MTKKIASFIFHNLILTESESQLKVLVQDFLTVN